MKIIGFVGVPGSGKSAVARGVAASAYDRIGKVELVAEYARRFITKYGSVDRVFDQYRILQKQLEWEDVVPKEETDVAITESPVHMGFLYAMEIRNPNNEKDTMYINDIFKTMNKVNCPCRYDIIFHLPPIWEPSKDGVRPEIHFDKRWREESDNKIQFIFKLFPPKIFQTITSITLDERIEECLSFCETIFR
jgi:nicotinamide riboside kinase